MCPIKVIDTIKPNGVPIGTNPSPFPTAEDIDIRGGYQVVDNDGQRNAIPNSNRKQGMLVYVVADSLFYQLAADLVTWNVANFASDTVLAGDVTGTGAANTVVKIRGTPVSTNSVANDGYALVSIGGIYVPTGITPVFNIKNYGAKGNGTIDDTGAISAAIAAAVVTGGTAYFPMGVYKVTGSFLVNGKCKIYMEKGGLIIPALPNTPENQKVFNVSVSNVEIDGLNFDYTGRQNGSEGTRYMVWAAGANNSNHITNVVIKNCSLTNIMTGNFVPGTYVNLDVAHAIFVTWVDECIIEKNFIQNVSGFGIFTEGCNFPTIRDNELIDTGWASISIKSGGFGGLIENNRILGQTIGRRDEGGSIDIPATPSEGMGPNSRLVIRNNYISGFVQYGNACRVGSSSYVDVDSNVFDQVWGTNIAPASGPTSLISFTTRGGQSDACHSIRVRGNVFIAAQAAQLSSQGQIACQVDNVLSGSGETMRGSDLIVSDNIFISPDPVSQFFTMAVMVHGQSGGWDNVDIHDNIGDGYCIPGAVLPGFMWVGASTSTINNVRIHHNTLNMIGTNNGNQYGIVVGQNSTNVFIDHNTTSSWNTPILVSGVGTSNIIVNSDLAYSTDATANTLAERDGSGNLNAAALLYTSGGLNYNAVTYSSGNPTFGNGNFFTTIDSNNTGVYMNVGGVNRFIVTSALTYLYCPLVGNGVPIQIQGLTKTLPSDADYTFSSAEYSNSKLTVQGTITLTRNMILPATQGAIYFVKNATTGGQSLTFKVTGQTGVTLANGLHQIIICNGTDYEAYTPAV